MDESGRRLLADLPTRCNVLWFPNEVGLAPSRQIVHTNTVERLRAAGRAHGTPVEETAAATDAFYQIQRLRLRNQISGEFPLAANRLNPSCLHELDRHILKAALRHAQRLQQRIGMNFGI